MSFISALHGILRRHREARKPLQHGVRPGRRNWQLALETLEERLCLSGNLFVNSLSTNAVLDYDGANGTFLQTFASNGTTGTPPGALLTPIGMAVGPNGDLFVAARGSDDVVRYDGNTGAYKGIFVAAGSGGLNGPDGLAFGPDGNLYVTSTGFNINPSGYKPSVLEYDGTTGAFIRAFVSSDPTLNGNLQFPHGLAFGPDHTLYVSDVNGNTVLHYDSSGAFLGALAPSTPGWMSRPTGLTFGPDGKLYVGSFSTNSVLSYDPTAGTWSVYASGGLLSGPQDVGFGFDGALYVSSFSTNEILRYNAGTGTFSVFASGGNLGEPTYFAFRQTQTATTLSPSVNPAVFGQSLTLTATVSSLGLTAGSPTGTVTFTIDRVAQTPVALNSSDQATFSTVSLGVGSHAITATYNSGDVRFGNSTSTALNEVVSQDGTATALSASADPTVFGQPVTFTATVTAAAPGAGTPTGTVTFFVDGTAQSPVAVSNGQATFTTSALGVGGHTITASYNADADFSSSNSLSFSQTVNRASATTTIVSSSDPSVFGQPVTITATVAAVTPGAGMPTGTVTFSVDGTTQTSAVLSNGQASFTTSALGVGNYVIAATYSGDGNFNASASGALSQAVNQASSATAVSASAAPAVFGQAVTFTATVAVVAPGAGNPSGTVTFTIDGVVQTPVALSNDQASITTAALGVGGHVVTAAYSGDGSFLSSTSAAFDETVNKADTGTTVSSSAAPSVFGQAVTFTATVAAVAPGVGSPSGTVTFTIDGLAQPTVTLSNDQASFTTSALTVGSHTVAVAYSGDGNFNSSTSSLSQAVNKADTTSAVSSSAVPSVFGQSVLFTAVVNPVAPGAGTLTGTVTFTVDGTAQAPVALNNGQATFATSALGVGSHVITASYNGDGNFNASGSPALSQQVNPADTTTAVSASVAPSVFGQAVTFTATVSAVAPGAGMPSGTVTFTIDGTAGTPVALGNGQASFTTSALNVGVHTVTVAYSGDGNFLGSTSAALNQTVNKADTAIAFSSSTDPSVFGEPVTFTAAISAVAPGAGTPSGTVVFSIDGVAQTPVAVGNGQASFTTSTLSVGGHDISINYSGDGSFNASNLDPTVTVNKAGTTTAVSASVAPAVFGQAVTFTATVAVVAPGAGNPSGTVTFTIDGVAQTPVALSNDQASFTTSAFGVGSHVVTAAYSGDGSFTSSSSAAFGETVNRADTTTAVGSSAAPSVFGQAVTFTATVAAVAPGAGNPSGTVTFTIDGVAQPTVTLSNDQASFTTSALTVGSHTVAVAYSGDGNFNSSTSSLSQAVNKAGTSIAFSASSDPSVYGQVITFTAAVSAVTPGAGTPTGTVVFSIDGVAQTPVTVSNGQASFTTSTLSVGAHEVSMDYSGDGNFNASTLDPMITVNKASTTTGVSTSVAPSVFGQAVTFTATVAVVAPGSGTPTGTVTFTIDGVAQTPVAVSNDQAAFTTSALGVGSHIVMAIYGGDGNFNSSTSAALSQAVNKADTTTTVSSSAGPSVFGQLVSFTATVGAVAPGAGTPSGTVTFSIDGVAQSSVTLSNGQATFVTSTLTVGSHTVAVTYSGDGSFNSDSSPSLSQTVNPANSVIAVSSSAAPSVFGQSVIFTAAVSAVNPGAGTLTGTVTFTVDGTAQTPVALSNGQASFASSALGVGSHVVTASYSGDGNFNGSASATLNQTVNQANTTTAASASLASSVFGQAVTFTATVSSVAPGAGVATGTITFTIDGTAQQPVTLSNGQATFTTSSLTVGSHTIAVSYSGDGNFNGSTSSLSEAVNKANTTLTVTSSAAAPTFGQAVTFTAAVSAVAPGAGSPTGTVIFTIDGTAQAPVTLSNGQAAFTTSTLSVGTHTIAVAYSGDGSFNVSSSTLSEFVNKTNTTISFSVSAEPSVFGQSVTFTAAISAIISGTGTITGTVTFSVDGTAQTPSPLINGQATFTTSTLSVGSHEIAMVYSGDANFNSSSLDPTVMVNQAATTTTVSAPGGPAVFGQPVTFTAAVAIATPGSGTPSGTVTFTVDGTAQTPVTMGNGQATFTSSTLTAGSHIITAAYSGNVDYSASTSSTFTVLVSKASTTTTLSSSANPSMSGQLVTFTATVSAAAQAGTPAGTVTFKIDGVAQPTVTLSNGQAVLSTAALTSGNHTVTVAYNGAANFNTSTSPSLTQVVNGLAGPVVLRASTPQSVFGQAVTFTATVNVARPTGSVTFIVDGKVQESVALKNGQATFTTSKLSVGNHSITARYNGGGSLSGTTSAAVNETVSRASTTTTIQSSAATSVFEKAVIFTAVAAAVAPGAGTPTGKVTFIVDGIAQAAVPLHDGRATFTSSTLGAGSHIVTASYSGDGSFNTSASSALKEMVSKAATKRTSHSSHHSSKFGKDVTFAATVSAADRDDGPDHDAFSDRINEIKSRLLSAKH